MTKLEQVARAMCVVNKRDWDDMAEREFHLAMARAAVEVLRPELVALIDAILAEGEEPMPSARSQTTTRRW